MTIEQVAAHLLCSTGKIRGIETNFKSGAPRDVRDLCDLYGVTDAAERKHLMDLAHNTRQQGWWEAFEVPYAEYVGLEADAISIKGFHCTVIPGLLQTEGYARATHEAAPYKLSRERIERGVQARIRRQRILTRENPLQFWAILDEATLHRIVGGPIVMREQLEQLLYLSRLPNVTVQVIPYSAGAIAAGEGAFTILEFASPLPGAIYSEHLHKNVLLEQPHYVQLYDQVFQKLCMLAIGEDLSSRLIATIIGDLSD